MSINPEYSLINTTDFINISLGTEKASIKLSDNQEVGFGKVLHKSTVLAIENVSAKEGSLSYYLSILANVVFVDLKGEIRQATYIGGTTKQGVSSDISQESVVLARAALSEISIEKIVGSELTLDVKYDLTAIVCKKEVVNAVINTGGAYEQKGEIKGAEIRKVASGALISEDEVETKSEVSLVLSSNAQFIVKNTKCNMDSVTIEGDYEVEVCYEKSGEEKIIEVEKYQIPFKEDIEAVGVTSGEQLIFVCQNKMTTVTFYSSPEDKNILSIKGEGIIDFISLSNVNYQYIEDVFDKEKELLPTFDTISCGEYLGKVYGKESVEQDFPVEELNKLVAVCSKRAVVIGSAIEENNYRVDVIAYISAIIDIDGSMISREFEIPVTILVGKIDCESCKIACDAKIVDLKVSENGQAIKVQIEIEGEVMVFNKETYAIITEIKVGDDKPENYSAIVVYIAKGNETQLDLSRAVNLTPAEIDEQVSIEYPLVEKQKVTLYRQKRAKK